MVERLNALLRSELAALAGYQKALASLRQKAVREADEVQRVAAEHQRTAAVLQESVQARGGIPATEPRPLEGSRALALIASDGLGRGELMAALLEAERHGLSEYVNVAGELDEEARELLERELLPRQRHHVERLAAMLSALSS